ncbi:hypothetical protein BH11ACT2_BH11ACT2_23930 [soil metagenome]
MTDVRTRAAIATAAAVGLFLLVQDIVGNVTGLLYSLTQGQSAIGGQAGYTTLDFFARILPIAVGVLLVIWRLAPVTRELALRSVLLRSLVAAGAGTILALVVGGIFGFVRSFTGFLFGNSFPYGDVANAFGAAVGNLTSAVTGFVALVPLVALAAVLLWLWLRSRPVE